MLLSPVAPIPSTFKCVSVCSKKLRLPYIMMIREYLSSFCSVFSLFQKSNSDNDCGFSCVGPILMYYYCIHLSPITHEYKHHSCVFLFCLLCAKLVNVDISFWDWPWPDERAVGKYNFIIRSCLIDDNNAICWYRIWGGVRDGPRDVHPLCLDGLEKRGRNSAAKGCQLSINYLKLLMA